MSEKLPIHLETRLEDGAKRYSSSAGRNSFVISERLSELLPKNAYVLEIASGTGEHGYHSCKKRPDIHWQPSDPDAESRDSQRAWAAELPAHMEPPLNIDTTVAGWERSLPSFESIFCANMIHIAPWAAALGLAEGASKLVKDKGLVILYGPFGEGEATAPSNLEFDESLKTRDPRWGVRDLSDVKHIFAKAGFNHKARIVMPKNNLMLVFQRSAP